MDTRTNKEQLVATLDCSGADSGKDECWPQWVNIAVPVLVCVLFVGLLALMFFIPSKPSPEEEYQYDEDRLKRERDQAASSRIQLLSSSMGGVSGASSSSIV